MRGPVLMSLLAMAGTAAAQDACVAPVDLAALPVTVSAPAPELAAPSPRLGAPTGVLAQLLDPQAESAEAILVRLRIEKCRTLAMATPAAVPDSLSEAAAYKPRTEFDNAPWRFDMSQNGKRMTADEFTAWMKAKGVRVATGAPAGAAAPAVVVEPAAGVEPAPGVDPAVPVPVATGDQ